MVDIERIFFNNEESFRLWLKKNHNISQGFWMIFYKKHSNKECITYKQALEVALCYGWIDSIVKSVSNVEYMQKFTPRKNTKNWSETNKKLVYKLLSENKMTEFGLRKIHLYNETGKVIFENSIVNNSANNKIILEPPQEFISELEKNKLALDFYQNISKSNKDNFLKWILSAKKAETQTKRIKEAIFLLKNNKKLGLK